MPKILSFFHTAVVHSDTFDALRDQVAPGVAMHHNIRTSWLKRAQGGIDRTLSAEIRKEVSEARKPVICTCTTIAPVAEAAGAIRIDQSMMQAAARAHGPVLMAYCLDSTRRPSLDLLQTEMIRAGNQSEVELLPLMHLWSLFEAGDITQFEMAIGQAVVSHIENGTKPACVVLAQASMAGAVIWAGDAGCPVLASPELAMRAGLALL